MVSTVKIEMDPRSEDQDMPDASVGLRLKAKPVKSSIGAQENAVFDQVNIVTEFELLCGESSSLFEGRVRALCLVTAFRQVACRNRTDRSYLISPIIIYYFLLRATT